EAVYVSLLPENIVDSLVQGNHNNFPHSLQLPLYKVDSFSSESSAQAPPYPIALHQLASHPVPHPNSLPSYCSFSRSFPPVPYLLAALGSVSPRRLRDSPPHCSPVSLLNRLGYDMSTFIRRYSRYLNEKAVSYRQVAFDFTKVNSNELTNGVINAAFMLLFKDAIRLFAAYNEGIINLLGKYCNIFQVGIDRGDIPDLSQAPSSLLDALEQHLASLEGKKIKDSTAASRATTLSNAVSSLASTGLSLTKVDEREKQAALEEEQARLKALKEQRLKELAKKPHTSLTTAASPVSTSAGGIMTAPAIDIFSTPSSSNSTSKLPNDLLDLQQPTFHPSVHAMSTAPQVASTWGDAVDDAIPSLNPFLTKSSGDVHLPISSDVSTFTTRTPTHEMFVGFSPSPVAQPHPSAGLNVDFESVFGNKSTNVTVDSGGFDELGGLLKPTVASQNQSLPIAKLPPNKLVSDDLDSSLANLVGNLGIGNGTTKNDVSWSQPGEKKLTGGSNWQPKVAPTTAWNAATMAPPVMAYPATTPTGMIGYGIPPQMGSVPVMTQPTLIYSQPVMRPPNPFGPVSGAQIQFM
ncbi:hypothetical protein A6R68_13131, partial [Neotoma lepida]